MTILSAMLHDLYLEADTLEFQPDAVQARHHAFVRLTVDAGYASRGDERALARIEASPHVEEWCAFAQRIEARA